MISATRSTDPSRGRNRSVQHGSSIPANTGPENCEITEDQSIENAGLRGQRARAECPKSECLTPNCKLENVGPENKELSSIIKVRHEKNDKK